MNTDELCYLINPDNSPNSWAAFYWGMAVRSAIIMAQAARDERTDPLYDDGENFRSVSSDYRVSA